jgi:hypothetical protein
MHTDAKCTTSYCYMRYFVVEDASKDGVKINHEF